MLSRDYMYNVFTALQPSAANDERLRIEINPFSSFMLNAATFKGTPEKILFRRS
jgi:hypothetical protein